MRGGAPVQIGVVSWGAGSTYDVYMKVAGDAFHIGGYEMVAYDM